MCNISSLEGQVNLMEFYVQTQRQFWASQGCNTDPNV